MLHNIEMKGERTPPKDSGPVGRKENHSHCLLPRLTGKGREILSPFARLLLKVYYDYYQRMNATPLARSERNGKHSENTQIGIQNPRRVVGMKNTQQE